MHCHPLAVLGEIEERRQFLSEMESLGQGQQYRSQIETEISQVRVPPMHALWCMLTLHSYIAPQKIRELEIIDRQRCNALAVAMKQAT